MGLVRKPAVPATQPTGAGAPDPQAALGAPAGAFRRGAQRASSLRHRTAMVRIALGPPAPCPPRAGPRAAAARGAPRGVLLAPSWPGGAGLRASALQRRSAHL